MKPADRLTPLLRLLRDWQRTAPFRAATPAMREQWQQRLSTGQPALTDDDFPEAAAAAALAVLLAARGLDGEKAAEIMAVYMGGGKPDYTAYALPTAEGEMYVQLACQAALAPLAADVRTTPGFDAWRERVCPVCGGAPALSTLGADGHRELLCGACLTAWRYPRIGCARCGQQDPHRLRVLDAEGYPGWSLMACLDCRGYIKNADLRVLPAPEDWRPAMLDTLPLDYAAIKWLTRNVS